VSVPDPAGRGPFNPSGSLDPPPSFPVAFASLEELSDVQIEDITFRVPSLAIDNAVVKDDVFAILSFIAIVALTILSALIGPSATDVDLLPLNFSRHSGIERLAYEFAPLTQLNRFFSLSLNFVGVGEISESPKTTIDCRFVMRSIEGTFLRSLNQTLTLQSDDGAEVFLFRDHIFSDLSINVRCVFEGMHPRFQSVHIKSVTAVPGYVFLQAFLRIVFSFFSLLFLGFFIARLIHIPRQALQIEQKLTAVLLLLTFLYCNPAVLYDLYRPTETYRRTVLVLEGVMKMFMLFFLLVIFGNFQYRHTKPGIGFFLGTFTFTVTVWVFSIEAIWQSTTRLREQLTSVCAAVWLLISVFRAWWILDPVDAYKFKVYLAATLGIATALHVGIILPATGAAVRFAVQFGVQNVFAFMMTYWHWPYSVTADQTYDQGGKDDAMDLMAGDSE
jgi:hypothetical protein